MLEHFVARFGYLAVGLGTLFEGETVLIAGGALARHGDLSLPGVIACAFAGGVLGDQIWFRLGHRFGPPLLERRPSWTSNARRAQQALARHGAAFVIGFRFMYGLRTITPIMLGASGYPKTRFTYLNLAGGALWALAIGGAGYALGDALGRLLQHAVRAGEVLALAIAIGVALWLWLRARRAR